MRLLKIFLPISILFILAGCSRDKVEIENIGYVAVIGIDKGERGGLSITLDMGNPQVGSTEIAKAENEPPEEILTFDVPDILTAQETAQANVTRRINYSHVKAIIVGEEFARSDNFYNYMGELMRTRELRGDASLIVVKEKASEFIKTNKPPLETRPHKFYTFMANRWKENAMAPKANLHTLLQRSEQGASLFLAIYGTMKEQKGAPYGTEDRYTAGELPIDTKNPVEFLGSAVFKNGKMIGTLTAEETRLTLMLRKKNTVNGIAVTYKDPLNSQYDITCRLFKIKSPKIKVDIKKGIPEINVEVPANVHVMLIPSHINYVEDINKQEFLKGYLEKTMAEKAIALVEKTQKEFGGEPFLWSVEARDEFWTFDEWRGYDWMKHYPNAKINVKYKIRITGFGKELMPSPMQEIRGEGK